MVVVTLSPAMSSQVPVGCSPHRSGRRQQVQASRLGQTMGMRSSKLFALLLLAALVSAACSGGSVDTASTTPEPTVQFADSPTPIPDSPTPIPDSSTPTAAPIVLTNEEMTAAAIAAFDASPEPAELLAWDHLDAEITANKVTLRLCSWTGDTVFNEVRLVNYLVEPDIDGNPTTQLIFSNPTPGECLNTQLINSAYEAINTYETYWAGVLEDPTTFNETEAAEFKSPGLIKLNIESVGEWVRDGLNWQGFPSPPLPNSTIVEILWRRYEQNREVFAVISCRELRSDYGLYQAGVLIDDFKPDNPPGTDVIDIFKLTRDQNNWIVLGVESFGWSNCLAMQPDWVTGVNAWKPDLGEWRSIEEQPSQ